MWLPDAYGMIINSTSPVVPWPVAIGEVTVKSHVLLGLL